MTDKMKELSKQKNKEYTNNFIKKNKRLRNITDYFFTNEKKYKKN